MKYILFTIFALALCLIAGWLLASLAAASRRHHGKPPMQRSRRILLGLLISLVLIAGSLLVYLLPYAHAEESALTCLAGTETVTVAEMEHGYYFDGPGEETAILFVPGAKVDARAYAPLLVRLAEGGADCFLFEPPFHMAFTAAPAAEEALSECPHEHWYAAGHSLGGVTASRYAIDHTSDFDGMILLAAYPNKSVPDGLTACSIYGSLDTRLDQEAYTSNRQNFPADFEEVVLDGGNHAQFGDYGPQKGDSPATISPEEQQKKTAAVILAFLGL